MLRSWLPQCIDFRVRSKRADECERHALATGSGNTRGGAHQWNREREGTRRPRGCCGRFAKLTKHHASEERDWRAARGALMPNTIDVVCPPGVGEGELISVNFEGASFNVTVPPGIYENETFAVELPEEYGGVEPPALPVLGGVVARLDAQGVAYGGADVLEAALNTVLDAIEDHDNPNLDDLVDGNCAEFREWAEGDEMPLHWSRMHEDYVALVEEHIGGVLESLECSAEDVFMYAQEYSGDDERIQRLIGRLLATVDLQAFCAMMRLRHEILEMFG